MKTCEARNLAHPYMFTLGESQNEMIFLNVIITLRGEGLPLWRFKMPKIHRKIKLKIKKCKNN